MSSNIDHFSRLPTEVLAHIFYYLPAECMVFAVRHVCRRWREVAKMKCIWKNSEFDPATIKRKKRLYFLERAPHLERFVPSKPVTYEVGNAVVDYCLELKEFRCVDKSTNSFVTKKFLQTLPKYGLLTHISLVLSKPESRLDRIESNIVNLIPLLNLPQLEYLVMYYCASAPETGLLNVLQKMTFKKMKHLELFAYSPGTDDLVLQIALSCPELRCLKLQGWDELTDKGVKNISQLCKLTHLDLGGCINLCDEAMTAISQCKTLVHLNLSGCSMRDKGLEEVIRNCRELEYFNVNICHNIQGSSLAKIPNYLSKLKILRVILNEHLANSVLDDLLDRLPDNTVR